MSMGRCSGRNRDKKQKGTKIMKTRKEYFYGTFEQVVGYTYKNNLKVYKKEIKDKQKEIKNLRNKIKQMERN